MSEDNKKMLLELIRQDGIKGTLVALAAALHSYADDMSDMGIKDKSHEAADIAGIIDDVSEVVEE
jgi:hypothetical protein